MDRRQELRDRIRKTSKQEVILEEMQRLGFWPRDGELPEDPAADIKRRGELERELRQLRARRSQLHNETQLKKEAHKRRLEESRARQRANRERRAQERRERAEAWREFKTREIVHLGPEHSAGLEGRTGDEARQREAGMPVLNSARALALAMDIDIGELRFLAYARPVSQVTHYVHFEIPKRQGGTRSISAPMPRLKQVQRWILDNLLSRVELHEAAHGFVTGRSIVTNARPHVGQDVVINCDIQGFFPSVIYPRVKGLWRSFGFSEAASTILALLCTAPEVTQVEIDGERLWVARGPRRLPQGAPTSPAITNLICRRMDARLEAMSQDLGYTYTRYADDMSFSASGAEALDAVGRMLGRARHVVEDEGFELHPDKTRVLRRGQRQEVTGVVVNEKLSVARDTLRRFRALLFHIERDGPEGKTWSDTAGEDVLASIDGFASFVQMVDARRGQELRARVDALLVEHGYTPDPGPAHASPKDASGDPLEPAPDQSEGDGDEEGDEASSDDAKKKKKWWKMW